METNLLLPPGPAPASLTFFSLLSALVQQVLNQPASLLVIVGLSIIAYVLEIWPKFPNAWIPIICILGGLVVYPFFAARASVPKAFPYPLAVLMVNGLICGLVAMALHIQLVRRLLARFQSPTPVNPDQPNNIKP